MNAFFLVLILATLCCALVSGITLIFAIVIMPGLSSLGDRGFLEGFKAIDRVIQDKQPIFMLVWIGSALALLAATILGFGVLQRLDQTLLMAAVVLYIPGVQMPTALVNVPLNNRLQTQELARLGSAEIASARKAFEPRWLRWNAVRTWFSTLTTIILLLLLLRI